MRYHALACDYDGTVAANGKIEPKTLKALESVRESGRKLILVTGRELDELTQLFPSLEVFDRIVAENGALLYRPGTREEILLADAPPAEFAAELIRRGAQNVSVGRVIVATWEPYEKIALDVIRDLGLELHVIFNKGAVMILPSGVNKATGLSAALWELNLSPHNIVGVGDAENDHAFLGLCERSVAVSNALETLQQRVDWVAKGDHGNGVIELIQALLQSDLAAIPERPAHRILLGTRFDGTEVCLKPYGTNVLIAGTSGRGKSTLATGFFERLGEKGYQYLIVDPEGDYSSFEGGVVLGDDQNPPGVNEVLELIGKPDQNVIVNLIGLDVKQRPAFFDTLLPRIQELRARTGRPHWMLVDEAHHVMPSMWETVGLTVAQHVYGVMLITLEPDRVAPAVLKSVDVVIAIGDKPEETLNIFGSAVGLPVTVPPVKLDYGEAVGWFLREGEDPFWFRSVSPKAERRRHRRKYAEGQLAPELCFYFRGPEHKLNLRAQNLNMFLQLAEGVDDETWMFHLKEGDFSTWFRRVIKDPELADEVDRMKADPQITTEQGRKLLRSQLEHRYILAA